MRGARVPLPDTRSWCRRELAQALGFTAKRPPNPGLAQARGAPCSPWSELGPIQGPRKQENGVWGGQKDISGSFFPEFVWLLSSRPCGHSRRRGGWAGRTLEVRPGGEGREAGASGSSSGGRRAGVRRRLGVGQRGARMRGALREGFTRSLFTGKAAASWASDVTGKASVSPLGWMPPD